MWPTPRARDWKDGSSIPPSRKKNPELATLGQKVAIKEQMWPTPRASNRMAYHEKPSPSMINGTHGWNLNSAVTDASSKNPHRMWPTPTTKGYGHASEGQTLIMRKMVEEGKLTEEEAKKMMNGTTLRPPRMENWSFPTPTARDHKDNGSSPAELNRNTKTLATHAGGTLASEWVELLMGYPKGWTDLKNQDASLKNVRVVWDENWEKDTPRVAVGQKDKMKRLKGLGNAIVPQIAEIIGKAIMEAEF